MTMRALSGAVLLLVVSLTISGCSRERIDWKSAEAADTQEAYNHFLERHPESELATQARNRLTQLAEDKDWQRASASDTADSYKQFLVQHPTGKFAEEARIRMENFSLDSNESPIAMAAAPQPAVEPTSPAARPAAAAAKSAAAPPSTKSPEQSSAPSPAARPAASPTPKPAAPAAAPKPTMTTGPASKAVTTTSATEKSESFGIQLGAFSSQAAALAEWKRLQTHYDTELHGLFAHAVPVQVTSGTLFRLPLPLSAKKSCLIHR